MGQVGKQEDAVHLKNGETIYGWILEKKEGEYIKLELVGGSVYVIEYEKIDEIKRVPSRFRHVKRVYNHRRNPISFRQSGAYAYVLPQFAFREGLYGPRLDLGLHVKVGYRINRFVGIAAGVGLDTYQGGVYMPLYADIQGDFLRRKVTPVYQVSFGYAHGVNPRWPNSDVEGGWMTFAGFGYKIHTLGKLDWTIIGGYKIQDVTETERSFTGTPGSDIINNIKRQGFTIQIGLGF